MERKRKIRDCLIICLLLIVLGCGSVERPAVRMREQMRQRYGADYHAAIAIKMARKANRIIELAENAKEDMAEENIVEDEPYLGTGQLEEDITEQIRIYVEQRDIWYRGPREPGYSGFIYEYTLNDINLDGTPDIICSYCTGSGFYSTSYIYTINAEGKVEEVERISSDGMNPDLTWGTELYADAGEEPPEHFYIRSIDYTPEGPYGYNQDVIVTFSADMTDWQRELLREHATKRWEDDSRPDDIYYDFLYDEDGYREWVEITRQEWEQLEAGFLQGKELIISHFEWSSLGPVDYSKDVPLVSSRELGEAMEELWLESMKQDE